MKKKIGNLIYIIIFMLICVTPFACMGIAGMQESTENTEKQAFPRWKEEGKWNKNYLSDMGSWFENNFAFRQQMVSANARLYADLFQVSSTKKITVGTDGWLYYSVTGNDYKGLEQMSDRGLFNLGRIVSMMQERAEENGSRFVFTVPPNKNSLYGENMPYYEKKVSDDSNIKRVASVMEENKIHYVDLYDFFQKKEETLYLKRDSHWNNKGALLVYNELLNMAQWPHNQYTEADPEVRKDCVGDLALMLYPEAAEPEENQYYPQIFPYEYTNGADSVEASEIETVGYFGTGSLLMYRDSFGNSLLPFMAGEFGKSYFTKLVPYYFDEEIEKHKPDVIVVEKVERHLKNLVAEPPVMQGPKVTAPKNMEKKETSTTFHQQKIENDYYRVMGVVDEGSIGEDDRVYIRMTDEKGESVMYEAFPVSLNLDNETSDYGYQLYLKEKSVPKGIITSEVIVGHGDNGISVKTDISQWKE
ncbi:MAG: hypothetical protein Q4D60_05320 [Eubacteriales bacterium]|nr:hypothetical protein [Eubacteriales bacterium]